jgi:molybdate transport system regulatory protein
MKPCAKLFISSESHRSVFGEGKCQLLCAVKRYGSISKAAASLDRSYRKAWGDIKIAEEALGKPLIIKKRGGLDGGQSAITEFCENILSAWEIHRETSQTFIKNSYKKNLMPLLEPEAASPSLYNKVEA